MTPKEFEMLKKIAEDASASRTLLTTHTQQIAKVFEILAEHANVITVIGTKQDLCLKRNDPGNKSERSAVLAAIVFGVISILWQLVNLFK